MNFHNSDGRVVNRCRTQTVVQKIRDGCRPAILLSDYGVSVLSLKIFNFSEKHLLIHTIGQTVVLVSIVSRISVSQYFYFSDRLTFHLLFNTTASILLFLTRKHKKQMMLVLVFTGCRAYFMLLDVSFQQVLPSHYRTRFKTKVRRSAKPSLKERRDEAPNLH